MKKRGENVGEKGANRPKARGGGVTRPDMQRRPTGLKKKKKKRKRRGTREVTRGRRAPSRRNCQTPTVKSQGSKKRGPTGSLRTDLHVLQRFTTSIVTQKEDLPGRETNRYGWGGSKVRNESIRT